MTTVDEAKNPLRWASAFRELNSSLVASAPPVPAIYSESSPSLKGDKLKQAELLLLINSLDCLAAIARDAILGRDFTYHPVAHVVVRDRLLMDILARLEVKAQPARAKLLALARDIQKGTEADSEVVVKARPEMFIVQAQEHAEPHDGNDEEEEDKSGLYKAPKTFAMNYTRDKKKPISREEEEDRIMHSEFVKALTEDLLPTPKTVGDGEDELDTKSRKVLKRFKEQTNYEEENSMRKRRTKGEEKTFRALREKQGHLTVGTSLHDLSYFVDKIGREESIQKPDLKGKPSSKSARSSDTSPLKPSFSKSDSKLGLDSNSRPPGSMPNTTKGSSKPNARFVSKGSSKSNAKFVSKGSKKQNAKLAPKSSSKTVMKSKSSKRV